MTPRLGNFCLFDKWHKLKGSFFLFNFHPFEYNYFTVIWDEKKQYSNEFLALLNKITFLGTIVLPQSITSPDCRQECSTA